MKKLLATILIILFVTSSALETYTCILGDSIVMAENEDGDEGKGVQKEGSFIKDKFFDGCNDYSSRFFHTAVANRFLITASSLLPHPIIAAEINPPNLQPLLYI